MFILNFEYFLFYMDNSTFVFYYYSICYYITNIYLKINHIYDTFINLIYIIF